MNKLLKILILVVIIKQLVWIAFIPLWHFPDEQAHFGQVANSVEVSKRGPGPNLTKEILLSEQILQTERDWAGNNRYTYHPEYNIPYTSYYYGFYEKEILDFPVTERSILTKTEATLYPPLYYIPAIFIYKTFYYHNLFNRVFMVRIVNILFTIIQGIIAYKIFILIFNERTIAFFGAVFLLFHPMLSFVQGGVNSDNLFNPIFSLGILVSLKIINEGLDLKKIVFIAIIFLLAYMTKPHAYFLIFIYLVPFVYVLIRRKSKKLLFIIISLIFVAFFPVINRWSLGMNFIPDISLNMIKQQDMNFPQFLIWTLRHTFREVFPWYWGVFRWLSLSLPRIVNRVINRVVAFALLGLIIYIFRIIKNRKIRFKDTALFFLVYITVIYFLVITAWDYLFYLTRGFSFGIQGRYFFPIITVHIALLIFAFLGFTLRKNIQLIVLTIVAFFTIIIHEISLFHVLFSYFSKSSISTLFITASQYKPWFFKAPILQFIMLAHIISLVYFCYLLIKSLHYEKA